MLIILGVYSEEKNFAFKLSNLYKNNNNNELEAHHANTNQNTKQNLIRRLKKMRPDDLLISNHGKM